MTRRRKRKQISDGVGSKQVYDQKVLERLRCESGMPAILEIPLGNRGMRRQESCLHRPKVTNEIISNDYILRTLFLLSGDAMTLTSVCVVDAQK